MIEQQIMLELQGIPEDKLAETYDLIHYFRVGLDKERGEERKPGLLNGKLGDAFFEPLPDKELSAWK